MDRVPTVTDTIRHNNRSWLACFALALLFIGLVARPAHAAGVAAPRYLYSIDLGADQIDIFTLNLSTGVLVPAACAPNPQPLGGFGIVAPTSAKVDPTGSFLYVTDSGNNKVIGLQILPNGCLANIAPGPWLTVGIAPNHLHISSNGEFLYVADTCGNPAQGCVEGFIIAPNGALFPVGPPSLAGAAQGGIAVDPVREYVYASDDSPLGPINVTQFGAGGVLGAFAANVAKRANPSHMFLDPVGNGLVGPGATQFLLTLSAGANFLDCYTINTATGLLGWTGAAATGVNPFSVSGTPLGQFAYVTNNGANTVSAFNLNGCVPAPDGAAVATGVGPTGITVDQTGRFVYVAATGGNQVWGYKVNLVNGTIAKINFWATGAGPVAIATTP